MTDTKWPPSLQTLLEWTASRVEGKAIMVSRFPPLLETHADLFPEHIVKITGTNGKGSVCAMLEAVLLADGQSIGLFTSPHLVHVTERIRINGVPISFEEIDEHARHLLPFLKEWVANRDISLLPSFFEVLILIALRAFHRHGIRVAVFEAGCGGANDSTSLLPGHLSAITSIGLDHQQILGDSLMAIAQDKAGIASPESKLVLGPTMTPEVLESIFRQTLLNDVIPLSTSVEEVHILDHTLGGIRFTCPNYWGDKSYFLNLSGEHQIENLSVTLKLLELLSEIGAVKNLPFSLDGLATINWNCRLMVKKGDPSWILDVAHNPPALEALKRSLDLFVPSSQRILLYGVVDDKDVYACSSEITSLSYELFLVEGFHRSIPCEVLESSIVGHLERPIRGSFSSPEKAVSMLDRQYCGTGKTIIVAGSLFLAGSILETLITYHSLDSGLSIAQDKIQ